MQRLRWLGDGGLCYFVRHNHDGERERAEREVDGIDGFLIHGRDASMFSESFLSIDFLWADIQGAEGEMIRGGQKALSATPFLYTEYSNDELYEDQVSLCEILGLLYQLPTTSFHLMKMTLNQKYAEKENAEKAKSVIGQNRMRVVMNRAANAATAKAGRNPTRNDHSIA